MPHAKARFPVLSFKDRPPERAFSVRAGNGVLKQNLMPIFEV